MEEEEKEKKNAPKEDYWVQLRERAIVHSQPPCEGKTIITHLGRQSKNQQIYDKQRLFQLQYDFEGLAQTLHRERDNIYLDKNAYEFLRTTSNSSNVNYQKVHKYKNFAWHKQRILREKRVQEDRKEKLWKE